MPLLKELCQRAPGLCPDRRCPARCKRSLAAAPSPITPTGDGRPVEYHHVLVVAEDIFARALFRYELGHDTLFSSYVQTGLRNDLVSKIDDLRSRHTAESLDSRHRPRVRGTA